MRNKIARVAIKVRKELEKIAANKKTDINAPPHLGGLCGYGSVMLYQALKEAKFRPQIAQSWGHWFVICEGYLVDVTASQFGQSKVVVRKYDKIKENIKNSQYLMQWWNVNKISGTIQEANLAHLEKYIRNARKIMQT